VESGILVLIHPIRGHSSIVMQLDRSDSIFNMGIDFMRPALNLDHKYRVTMLTRQEWTRGPGTPPVVKGLVWFTDGSRAKERTGGWILWANFGKKAQYLSRKACYSFSG